MFQLHYDEHSDQYFNTHAGSVVAAASTGPDTTPKVIQLETRFPLFSVIRDRIISSHFAGKLNSFNSCWRSRARSAVDLAVHSALIPCVCLSVCPVSNSFLITPRIGPSLFLSTGKHPVGGQLPRVFFSALPGQSRERPNLPPHKKLSIFQFPFASIRRATSEASSGLGKRRIDRSTSKRSSKKLQRAAITSFFLDRSLVVVHCDRS